ncbi:MAG: hypothetical protein AAFY14_09435 [Pseudomonadota bacterium]
MNPTRTLTVDIDAPFSAVMSELSDPMQHPSWATEFFDGEAEVDTNNEVCVCVPRLGGICRMKVEADVELGIVDIYLARKPDEFGKPLPVRVIENGQGATVLWTLSQFPGLPDDAFTAGCASMQLELDTLKSKLERQP